VEIIEVHKLFTMRALPFLTMIFHQHEFPFVHEFKTLANRLEKTLPGQPQEV
jgi:hypothetical protein